MTHNAHWTVSNAHMQPYFSSLNQPASYTEFQKLDLCISSYLHHVGRKDSNSSGQFASFCLCETKHEQCSIKTEKRTEVICVCCVAWHTALFSTHPHVCNKNYFRKESIVASLATLWNTVARRRAFSLTNQLVGCDAKESKESTFCLLISTGAKNYFLSWSQDGRFCTD